MDDSVQQELKRIIAIHGRRVCHDPQEFAAALREACPEQTPEVNLLIKALEDRVPGRLLALPDGMPWEPLTAPLVRRLVLDLGITEDEARWTVDTWGLALLKVKPKDVSHTPPPELVGAGSTRAASSSKRSFWKWLTGNK